MSNPIPICAVIRIQGGNRACRGLEPQFAPIFGYTFLNGLNSQQRLWFYTLTLLAKLRLYKKHAVHDILMYSIALLAFYLSLYFNNAIVSAEYL